MDLIDVDYADMARTAAGFQEVAADLRRITLSGISTAGTTYGHAGLAACMAQMLAAFTDRQDASADAAEFIGDTLEVCSAGYKTVDGWGATALDGIRTVLESRGLIP